MTTGRGSGAVLDVDDIIGVDLRPGAGCGGRECVAETTGSPFECSGSRALAGATLAAAFPTLDLPAIGDTVTTLALALEPLVHVVGTGTPESCTEAALDAALAEGGTVTFDCGPEPVTITLTSEKVVTSETTVDGGGLITLDGNHAVRAFSVGEGVILNVRNLRISNGSADDGPTQTIALLPGSPAIDAGDPEVCANPPVNGLDQRGWVRQGTGYANCSIGAYEYNSPGPPPTCTGDCHGDGQVTIDELIMLVRIALDDMPMSSCPVGDADGDQHITAEELIAAVHHAMDGCTA